MSRFKLKHWQRRRLQRQLRETSDVRLYRKTLAMLELDRGRPAADIAEMLGVTRQTVPNTDPGKFMPSSSHTQHGRYP
jgi:hypothetical protein